MYSDDLVEAHAPAEYVRGVRAMELAQSHYAVKVAMSAQVAIERHHAGHAAFNPMDIRAVY